MLKINPHRDLVYLGGVLKDGIDTSIAKKLRYKTIMLAAWPLTKMLTHMITETLFIAKMRQQKIGHERLCANDYRESSELLVKGLIQDKLTIVTAHPVVNTTEQAIAF
jgi:hypothetical protein